MNFFTFSRRRLPRFHEPQRRSGSWCSVWGKRCFAVGLSTTGRADAPLLVAVVPLLRASHIKPWAVCASDSERLDVFNGLLLAPNLDATFDCGLMTVADDGAIVLSEELKADDCRILGLDTSLRVGRLDDAHRIYLAFHRERVFRGKSAKS
jgi:hypothetical protein